MLDAARRFKISCCLPIGASTLLALATGALAPASAQVAGPNVNMVSGTQWPGGDPFLQRQNEPSLAVSTRNPAHLLAGANDYRTVDLPGAQVPEDRDAWLGVFKSFDGGLTWQSTLLPGYPQDQSAEGLASPLKAFTAAADPVVRAGTDGLFYYSGITFNRGSNVGQVFVGRFFDLNNKENGDATLSRDSIKYLDAAVIDTGTAGQFLDKPWLGVDVPRAGAGACTIPVSPTQSVLAGNVYLAYAKFTGSNSASSQVLFVRSLDCGRTWSKPVKLSANDQRNQGTDVAVDPVSGAIYVTYRRFTTNSNNPDALVVVKSTDFGQTFSPGVDATLITPFDQLTTPTQFRTATLPSLAVSVDAAGTSRVHLAWAQRSAPGADAHVVVSTSRDGSTWSAPAPVDATPVHDDFGASFSAGHQFMPSLTFGEGRLLVLYYDQRLDQTLGRYQPNAVGADPFAPDPVSGSFYKERRPFLGEASAFGPFIDEAAVTRIRHLLELRVAQALPTDNPVFTSSRVSRFRFGANDATSFGDVDKGVELEQLDVNPPNLPMFKQGTLPFIGDYIEVAGLSFVTKPGGGWKHNTDLIDAPTYHAVWTSNQDVVPPPDGDWTRFTPVGSGGTSLFDPTQQRPACVTGYEGTRNQNVYTSRISEGLLLYSPQNAKPLDLARAFVVIAQNSTPFLEAFRFTLTPATGVYASFQNKDQSGQDVLRQSIEVAIPPGSSVARSVFTKAFPANPAAGIRVDAVQLPADGSCALASGSGPGNCQPTAGGLTSAILLNPPGALGGALAQPDGSGDLISTIEVYTPTISSASVTSPNLASVTSASVTSASVTSASVTSASVTSSHLAVPQLASVTSASVTSASVTSNNLSDASVTSQPLASVTSGNILASVTSASISDANYTLTNTGNTTHSYHVKLVGSAPSCGSTACPVQLILSKPYGTPFAVGCQLVQSYQPVTVVNVDDVSSDILTNLADVPNPDIPDPRPTNATITLGPGESGVVTIRGPLSLTAMAAASARLVPVVVPHAGDSYAAPLFISSDGSALPVILVGVPYTATLTALGGRGPYVWSVVSGSLPGGLSLGTNGSVTGTPTAAGSSKATLQVTDAAGATATKELAFTVAPGPSATGLTAVPASPAYGTAVTLAATVGAAGGGTGAPAPGGTVSFEDGGTTLGTSSLAGSTGSSTATLTLPSPAAGAHVLTARYPGDANYTASSSPALTLSVGQAVPRLTVSGGTFTYDGATHAATAVATGVGGVAVAGSVAIGYSPGGTSAPVAAGSYAVTASFTSSDPNYANASGTATIVIAKASTATSLTAAPATVSPGQAVTLTATVSVVAPGAGAPTGTVTFRDGTTVLGTSALAGATASFSSTSLAAGSHSVTATYNGDSNFNASAASAPVTVTVKPPYSFSGFQTPLATAGSLSGPSSSGSWSFSRVLPIKWQLLDSSGSNVTALSSTSLLSAWFAGATCPGTSAPPAGPDANTVILYSPTQGAAGGSTFRAGSSGFIFNWDATKGSKGTGCYWIRLKLDDGSPEKVTTVLLN